MDEILSSDRTTPIGYHTSSLSLGGWVETQPSRIGSSPERMKKPKVRKFGRGATFLECHEEQINQKLVFSAMLNLAGSRISMASGSRKAGAFPAYIPASVQYRISWCPEFDRQTRWKNRSSQRSKSIGWHRKGGNE